MHCKHYSSLVQSMKVSETFREFRVFVFTCRAITENAELAENKIRVIFDWENPWKGIRVSWEIILRLFYLSKTVIYKLKKHLPSVKVSLNSSFGSGPWVYVGNIESIPVYLGATTFCWVSFFCSSCWRVGWKAHKLKDQNQKKNSN